MWGRYDVLPIPHPENGQGDVYYQLEIADVQPDDGTHYKELVGFYSAGSNRFYLVGHDGDNAEQQLQKVGPTAQAHAHAAVVLVRGC